MEPLRIATHGNESKAVRPEGPLSRTAYERGSTVTELDPGKPLATTSEKGIMDATGSTEHEMTAALRAGTTKKA